MPLLIVAIAEYEAVLRHAESSVLYTLELVERGLRIQQEALPWYRRWFRKPTISETPVRALSHVRELLERLETWKLEFPDLDCVVVPAWPDPRFRQWVELARDYRSGSSFPPPCADFKTENFHLSPVSWRK